MLFKYIFKFLFKKLVFKYLGFFNLLNLKNLSNFNQSKMSEAGDDEAKYRIRFDLTGEVTNNSRDFTGKASASYNNGDSYTGEYKDGV